MNKEQTELKAIELLPFGQYGFIELFGKELYIKSISYSVKTGRYTLRYLVNKMKKVKSISLTLNEVNNYMAVEG